MKRAIPMVTALLFAACSGAEGDTASDTDTGQSLPDDNCILETRVSFGDEGTTTVTVETVADGLAIPWSLDWLPDGAMLVTERGGTVRRIESDGTLQVEPVATVPITPPDGTPHYELSGCVPNDDVLAELERLGGQVCDREAFGSSITFANVQLARIAPNGPYHIYEDYVIQTLPLFLDVGGCLGGAWLCEDEDSDFDGVFIPSYPSTDDILQVSSETGSSGPGGDYGDATYADLRLGGVEIIVRNLVDTQVLTP